MIFTLTASALASGAPTHHAERALLSIWLLFALTTARLLQQLNQTHSLPLFLTAGAAVVGGILRVSGVFEIQPFTDRSAAVRFGREIAAGIPLDQKVALALSDYGYFALMAAAGHPERFVILNKHDPRHQELGNEALDQFLDAGGCLYVTEQSAVPRAGRLLHDSHPPFQLWVGPSCVPGQLGLR